MKDLKLLVEGFGHFLQATQKLSEERIDSDEFLLKIGSAVEDIISSGEYDDRQIAQKLTQIDDFKGLSVDQLLMAIEKYYERPDIFKKVPAYYKGTVDEVDVPGGMNLVRYITFHDSNLAEKIAEPLHYAGITHQLNKTPDGMYAIDISKRDIEQAPIVKKYFDAILNVANTFATKLKNVEKI